MQPLPGQSPKDPNKRIELELGKIVAGGLKFNFTKINTSNNRVNDTLISNIGLIRFNINEDYLTSIIKLFSSYKLIIKSILEKILNSEHVKKQDNLVRELYDLKTLILDHPKMNDKIRNNQLGVNNGGELLNNLNQDTDAILEYRDFLKNELTKYDKSLLEQGRYEVNKFFNLLNKQQIDISVNLQSAIVYAFGIANDQNKLQFNNRPNTSRANQDVNICKLLGKMVIPSSTFRLTMNTQKISIKAYEIDIEYYDLEIWRKIISNLVELFDKKILLLKNQTIKPFIDQFFQIQSIQQNEMMIYSINHGNDLNSQNINLRPQPSNNLLDNDDILNNEHIKKSSNNSMDISA